MGLETWFVDAWSVLDGIAFASLRDARQWDEEKLTPSTTTVIIGPPDWRAVSIARITTALRATRGPFQESVFDENDEEMPFASLDDIRDVVRRSYLAGGIGLDDAGTIEAMTGDDLPKTPGGSGEWADVHRQLLALDSVDARSDAKASLVDVFGDGQTREVLADVCSRITTHLKPWFDSEGTERRRDWTDYIQWLQLTVNGMRVHDRDTINAVSAWYEQVDPMTIPSRSPFHQRQRLLFRLPAMGQYPGYPPIRTLGDQLLLACASRKCLQSLDTPDAFLPIVVGALVLATAAHGDQIRGETMDAQLLLEPALRWLAQVLPPKRDDESVQERMLEAVVLEIARRKAGGTTESTPTP
jgi:hypothetical protein